MGEDPMGRGPLDDEPVLFRLTGMLGCWIAARPAAPGEPVEINTAAHVPPVVPIQTYQTFETAITGVFGAGGSHPCTSDWQRYVCSLALANWWYVRNGNAYPTLSEIQGLITSYLPSCLCP
jgi:hypothetical protein